MSSDRPLRRLTSRRPVPAPPGSVGLVLPMLWFTIGSALGIAACTAPVPGPEADPTQATGSWAGLYRGVLPCADCEGIDTLLELRADGTWERTLRYLGASDTPVRSSGRIAFSEPADASAGVGEVVGEDLLLLEPGTTDRTSLRIEADALRQLDRERQVIGGELADRYRLRRIGSGTSDPRHLDGEWWVVELGGRAVEADRTRRRRPHLRFDFVEQRLSFTGGCNQFAGAPEFEAPGQIALAGPFAGTRMLCPGRADLDQELTDALQSVRAWRIGSGDAEGGEVLELLAGPENDATIRLTRPGSDATRQPEEAGGENP